MVQHGLSGSVWVFLDRTVSMFVVRTGLMDFVADLIQLALHINPIEQLPKKLPQIHIARC